MKNIVLLATYLVFTLIRSIAFADPVYNLSKEGVILGGYDAVSYFQGKEPLKGDPKFSTKVGEVTYRFANEANLKEFQKSPSKYEPQFGGWCAYAVADSKSKVEVDPKSYVIQNDRLLLFYNGLWGDTRSKWLNTKDKTKEQYLTEADKNWPEVKTKEP